jgi:hypothetical protein
MAGNAKIDTKSDTKKGIPMVAGRLVAASIEILEFLAVVLNIWDKIIIRIINEGTL